MAKDKALTEEDTLKTLRDLDQGDGVTLAMGVGSRVDYYFTNNLDKSGLPKGLSVEMSSIEYDNHELLHYLLGEMRQD